VCRAPGGVGGGVGPRWLRRVAKLGGGTAHLPGASAPDGTGLGGAPPPALAACGAWAPVEVPRRCQMATAPPTGGEWRAWYARLGTRIDQYHARHEDAGRCARRLRREMDARWVFLAPHGGAPPTNRAERALRGGVRWRQRSLGTARPKGTRGGERSLSRKATCRLPARATDAVLVDAVTRFLHGPQPARSWSNAGVHTTAPPR
jgi:hypothetical protein